MKTILLVLLLTGCATIVKSEHQTVRFIGGPDNDKVTIRTPDGNFDIVNGEVSAVMTRSKEDIPITVECNATPQKTILPTSYDWGWAGLGNVVFGGIPGLVIDGLNNKGYDIKTPFNVDQFCSRAPSSL